MIIYNLPSPGSRTLAPLLAAVSATALLAGCGGSSTVAMDDDTMDMDNNNQPPSSVSMDMDNNNQPPSSVSIAGGSSVATPDGITEVTARRNAAGTIIYSVANGMQWSVNSNGTDGTSVDNSGSASDFAFVELSKTLNDGSDLYVDVYTDIGDAGRAGIYPFTFPTINVGGQFVNIDATIRLAAEFGGVDGVASCTGCSYVYMTGELQMTSGSMTFTPNDGSAATELTPLAAAVEDTDYLTGGVWSHEPANATNAGDFEIGAFGHGSDPFLASSLADLEGRATYSGTAVGIHRDVAEQDVTYFSAGVELNADFDAGDNLGTIGGMIDSFESDDGSSSAIPGALTLQAAEIGNAFSGTIEAGTYDGDSYVGAWAGQFYGNGESDGRPGSAAGTFNAATTGGDKALVGSFATYAN